MIVGVDAGNYETKVCSEKGVFSFYSDIGEYRERNLEESFGDDDIIWEYGGEKGFAGSLARFESEFGGTIKGITKAHQDAKLRVLIALHKYGSIVNKIVVGQPIESHNKVEKDKIKKMLKGKHNITINGVKKTITINSIEVAPEGSIVALALGKEGLIRILDIGSGTINFATIINFKRIDKDSFTEQIGMETTKSKSGRFMATKIYRILTTKWNPNDKIYLVGGGAQEVYKHIKEMLPNCEVFSPKFKDKLVNPKYSNAVGFYNLAKGLFKNEK